MPTTDEAIKLTADRVHHLVVCMHVRSSQLKTDCETFDPAKRIDYVRKQTNSIAGHLRALQCMLQQLKSANTQLDMLQQLKSANTQLEHLRENGIVSV